jgi:predicted site-specific integrase-resolvase
MKSAEVLKLLNITRVTLSSYVKLGKIKVIKKGNGCYDYDEDSIYAFLNITKPKQERVNVIYCRVSTYKQKNDLANQITNIINYCNDNNIKYDKIYNEIASGIDFDRKEFSNLINQVINNKINNIFITNKDRISRLSFLTLENMFKKFGTSIIVINDIDKHTTYENELFEELINIIHLFSTKMFSNRRKQIIDDVKNKLDKNNIDENI